MDKGMMSGKYNKETNRLKNRVYNSDEVNYARTKKRMTLLNVRKGMNSVVGVRNNGVTMSDLVSSYKSDGIGEDKIPWDQISVSVIEELERQEELARVAIANKGKVLLKPKILLKPKAEIKVREKVFELRDYVKGAVRADGMALSDASLEKYSKLLRAVQGEWGETDVEKFMKRLGDDPLGAMEMAKKHYKGYVDLLYAVEVLIKFSVYGNYLSKGLVGYKAEADIYYYLEDVEKKRATNEEKLKLSWLEAMKIYEDVKREKPYSQKHVLLSMLLLMPPLRDDLGKLRISGRIPLKENCYVRLQKRIYIYDQKEVIRKGLAVIEVPDEVSEIIEESLRRYPRDYLITQKSGDIYEKGKIWRLVSQGYGYSLNDFRKTYTTHVIDDLDVPVLEKMRLLRGSLHTVRLAVKWYYFPEPKKGLLIGD
jgi:hypothetical protein